ncbi:MAG: nucleotidyltransferase family protein [Gemmatimonadetes bacterium]|nr:nucleotidyltransferase family protein [Gemmatimonadota bacterium]
MVQFDGKQLADICRRHDVRRLRIFGSASRGEEGAESDIDLLVDFGSPKGFFELLRLEDELEGFFGRPVDVVTEPGLSPYLREPILASASVIFDAAA